MLDFYKAALLGVLVAAKLQSEAAAVLATEVEALRQLNTGSGSKTAAPTTTGKKVPSAKLLKGSSKSKNKSSKTAAKEKSSTPKTKKEKQPQLQRGPQKLPAAPAQRSCWQTCEVFKWTPVMKNDFCRPYSQAERKKKKLHEGYEEEKANRLRCHDAYHTMIEHRDWTRTWEGPPTPSSDDPYINHTMEELQAPVCSSCQLRFYTAANIRNMLCNIHAQLGERPQLVFQGSSVTRGQLEDFIRYLTGGNHDMHFGNRARHGPWVLEAPHCIIYYYFTGGLYSEIDYASRRVPFTHDLGSVEHLLELSTGKEQGIVHVHKNNESDLETGALEDYEFALNKPSATILVEFGPSVWDNCYQKASVRDTRTANHSANLIHIMGKNRHNLAPGAQVLFRTIPKISAGSKNCHGKGAIVNNAIHEAAKESSVQIMPFHGMTVNNRRGSVDGIHWHCTAGSSRNTKINTTNATDGESLECYEMPSRSEVSLASAFFIADALLAYSGSSKILREKCTMPHSEDKSHWHVRENEEPAGEPEMNASTRQRRR